jgi:DNA-binding IclR family transcriptional regulator
MSSTVAKALALLEQFSEDEPEIGLSELTRRSGINKASVYRLLTTLSDAGLVEQRESTRAYALGAGILRLAQIREATSPITSIVQPALEKLAQSTEETAHGSLISGRALATIGVCDSPRSARVTLVAGEVLPFHSTASGIAVLSFGSETLHERVFSAPLEAKTDHTVTDPDKVRANMEIVKGRGYAVSVEENEDDVFGIAVPFFDKLEKASGALAVATPCHRMTEELKGTIVKALAKQSEATTFAMGGRAPASFKSAIKAGLQELDT